MVHDITNEYYKPLVASSKKNFVNFIKINTDDIKEEDCTDEEIERLIQRVSKNMYYYRPNIETAKSDYHYLIGMLVKRGLLFKEFKDMKPDPNAYE